MAVGDHGAGPDCGRSTKAGEVRVGIVGAGRIGRLHARHLARRVSGAHLVAVADVDLPAAQSCAAELSIPSAVDDYRIVLDDATVDAVVICSSTETHARIIEDSAIAGKHIFCEKPIDLDLDRIDHALATVAEHAVKLQVGFNRRFDPSFLRVHEVVSSGEIGEPHIIRITSRDPMPPPLDYIRRSGGMFLDMTIHDFDMARFLVGREVVEVYATGAVLVSPAIGEAGDVDTAVTVLRFDGGAVGTIDNSRRAIYGYDQRVEVFCRDGCVAADNSYSNTTVVSDAQSVHRDLPLHFFIDRYTAAYVAEMQAFIDCIREDLPPPVSGDDGRAPVAMGLAARRSLSENRPIRLDTFAPRA